MSVKVMSAVWEHSTVKGNDLLVLLALADNADEDRGLAWPSIDTVARKARVDRRTAQRCLRRLEEAGELSCVREGGRYVDGYKASVYHVTPGGQGRQSAAADVGAAVSPSRGGTESLLGAAHTPPQPSVNHHEPSSTPAARARKPPDFPADFPDNLKATTEHVTGMLNAIATAYPGARVVELGAVARTVARYPQRDYVAVAQDAELYLLYGDGARRGYSDLVRFYGNSLKRSAQIARPEGAPMAAGPPPGVTNIRGRRDPEAERQARQARRMATANGGAMFERPAYDVPGLESPS